MTAMARDVRFLSRAIVVAKNNTYNWHMGAVIAKGNRFIAAKPNKFRNDPLVAPGDASIHAEEAVIKLTQAWDLDLTGCTIYVARYAPSGTIRMARPCGKCMKLILDSGIRRIVYTNVNGLMSIEKVANLS